MKRSVVLLSAGLDSTVNLYRAAQESQVVLALTFDYGQRAAKREIEHAAELAKRIGTRHHVIELPWFRDFTKTSLVDSSMEIPTTGVSIDDLNASTHSAKAVWVPNRNGIFLNIGAAFAEGLEAEWIVPGFNLEEAQTFPDNSEAFLQATTRAFQFSTSNKVQVRCFTTELTKPDIVKLGRDLKVPFDLIWTCYFGGEKQCGVCESCKRYQRALA
ncbi:7-cyano-7-deazaguanine synthase QueC [soil metagenome]